MSVEVFFTADAVEAARLPGATAVVIDVVRATTSVVEALANDARAVYPTPSPEEASRLANSLGRDDTLLCGERNGLKIDGFDLGNSPREFTAEAVGEKRLVMTTTNGTRALLAVEPTERVLIASVLNLGAVVDAVADAERVAVVCAGKEGRFALEDAVCAGELVEALLETRDEDSLDDAGRAARILAREHPMSADFLASTAAGLALEEVGLADDLAFCAERDRHAFVPEMKDRMIRRAGT